MAPLITESYIEDGHPSDQVGCVRNFTLTDGGHLRERLLSFSDFDHALTYNILVSPMPIENYVAPFRCTPVTERSFVEWRAEFDVGSDYESEIKEKVGRNTFAAGIRALASRIRGPGVDESNVRG